MPTLKFQKTNPDAKIPTRATDGSAGYDLYLDEDLVLEAGGKPSLAHFGVAVEIPEGCCGLLIARSSLHKKDTYQSNSVGVIDSDYRGELMAPMHTDLIEGNIYISEGTRIAQLVIVPCLMAEVEEVDQLAGSTRGSGGFGSSGS